MTQTVHLGADGAEHADARLIGNRPGLSRAYAEWSSRWYLKRLGRLWCLGNIAATLAVCYLAWSQISSAIILSWTLFLVLNALLCFTFLEQTRDIPPDHDPDNASYMSFFAAVFGGGWGLLLFVTHPSVDGDVVSALQMIVIATAATAIPTFALHRVALHAFFFTLALPAFAAHYRSPVGHSDIFFLLLLLLFVVGLGIARTQERLASMLSAFLGLDRPFANQIRNENYQFENVVEGLRRKLARNLPGNSHLSSSLDAVADGVISINGFGFVEYLNPIAEVMTGTVKGAAQNISLDELLHLKCNETQALLKSVLNNFRDHEDTQIKRKTTLVREDGIEFNVELTLIPLRNELGYCDGVSVILREMTDQNLIAKEANWRASYDPLTKLLNRKEFETRLHALFNETIPEDTVQHALCVFDLDNFQHINETYSHQAGDRVLATLADEFDSKIRGADILARVGDDKFAVLLIGCKRDKARMIAEGLRRIAEESALEHNEQGFTVTISAGVVSFDPSVDNMTDVLVAADSACNNAKKAGGNRVFTILDEDADFSVNDEIKELRHIQNALSENQLMLQTRSISCSGRRETNPLGLSSGSGDLGCEVLLRMVDADGNICAPRRRLAASQRFQLMPELDRWGMKATLDAVRMNHPQLAAFRTIFISLSGQSLNDDNFIDAV
ncbi:MAG: diguanylate cyclase, partial [Pseudomonadota bacterium]